MLLKNPTSSSPYLRGNRTSLLHCSGKAACPLQLLQDKVHLKAGRTLVSALTHVREQAQAARSSRRAHARGSLGQAAVLRAMGMYGALIMNATSMLTGLKQVCAIVGMRMGNISLHYVEPHMQNKGKGPLISPLS